MGERDDQVADALIRAYALAGQLIIDEITRGGLDKAIGRRASLLRQIDEILAELTDQTTLLSGELVQEGYRDGSAVAADRIRELFDLGDDLDVSFGRVDQDAVAALASRLFNDLGDATQLARRRVAGLVQDTQLASLANEAIRDEVAAAIARGATRVDLTRRLEPLVRDGVIPENIASQAGAVLGGLQIQVGGWTGPLSSYAELVARTMQREAATIGAVNRMTANGLDIMEVTTTRGTDDSCRVYEGLLISISGQTEGFPTLAQLPRGGTPFHPRCTHSLQPRSLDFLTPGEIRAKTRIRKSYLGVSYGALQRRLRSEFGGDAEAMRRAARG